MNKKNDGNRYVSFYEIGGTTYEVETSFSGTERSNNKIIRLILSKKYNSKRLTIRGKRTIITSRNKTKSKISVFRRTLKCNTPVTKCRPMLLHFNNTHPVLSDDEKEELNNE